MRRPERGSAMLVTMIIVAALLAGAAVLTRVQATSTRGAQMTRSGLTALYCAEAGITASRAIVAASYPQWNASLGQTTEPSWLAAVPHDIDGDSQPDFTLSLRDNDDEHPNNLAVDNDLTVFIVSRCIKDPDREAEVVELVRYNGGGNCYQSQLGGCGGNNNAN